MVKNLYICLSFAAVIGALLLGVSYVPALTVGYDGSDNSISAIRRAHTIEAHAYCSATRPDVDCNCFAEKAGQVMSQQTVRVRGAVYADPVDLARVQAGSAC
ncbi:MAG: hypothetical protein AB8B71_16590 [Paracoccaceae bacterium]